MFYADHFIMVSNDANSYEEPVRSVTETKPFYMNPIHSSNRQLYEVTSVPHYEFDSQQSGNAVRYYTPTSLLHVCPYKLLYLHCFRTRNMLLYSILSKATVR